ncbi:MAG: roadblock/LC7 domain-containing protein [Deltaproteobacteria bacterium]|nr:roadblock/LC7 domain-containing protein [Deltaproteobacteria bacterium]
MKGEGVPRLELTEEQHRRLVEVLGRVRSEHRARLAFLVEVSGRPLAVCGDYGATDLDALASLAASALAAGSQLAEALGEAGAGIAIHRSGRELLQLVPNGQTLLALAFGPEPLQDLERLRARLRLTRALAELRSVLARGEGAPAALSISDEEIEEALAPMGKGEA